MNENILIREESQPFKDLFTSLINRNLELTNEVKQIKTQINDQCEYLTQQTKHSQLKIDGLEEKLNRQIKDNESLKKEFHLAKQDLTRQTKDSQLKIDRLQQELNQQIQNNENLNKEFNLFEQNLEQQTKEGKLPFVSPRHCERPDTSFERIFLHIFIGLFMVFVIIYCTLLFVGDGGKNHVWMSLITKTKRILLIKDYQLEIDQLKQSLNKQIQINQNLTNKLNLVEGNLKRHSDHLTKLDNDQQESAIQSKQHFTQQTTNLQLEIDQLKQKLNQQNDHLTKLDNDQQESSNQSKQHLQLIQHRENYHIRTRSNLKWKPNAQTIAGGNRGGDKLNQLSAPNGIYVDHQQQHIYIVDHGNHRVVKWKLGENNGQIVAGGYGQGNRIYQLNRPSDVIVDENNKYLIICDYENKRVVRWSLQNRNGDKEILIENIRCQGLMMNENGDLFVSDYENDAVKRWRKSEIGKGGEGTIVAGGNGRGNKLNQLNYPSYIFIDREETLYVSDQYNHRVMKWLKGASEGIIAAGGQGEGNSLNQLSYPKGLVVNELGDIYVADCWNHRIMCWSLGSKEGRVVVGGNGEGQGSNQLNSPYGLSFDVENNLYVVDQWNHRIQRFKVDNKD